MKRLVACFLVLFLVASAVLIDASFAVYAQEEADQGAVSQTQNAGGQNQGERPRLLVKSYATSLEPVHPGAEFDLCLTLSNASGFKAQNILLTLGTSSATRAGGDASGESTSAGETSAALAILGTSNARFIQFLEGEKEAEVTLRMISSGKATPGVYNLPVKIEYENISGTNYTSDQTIGLVVKRRIDLSLASLEFPKTAIRGKSFTLRAEIANRSDFTVKGVSVRFESDNLKVSEGDLFIGDLEAGDSDVLEAKVVGEETGEKEGKVTVKYRDDLGQEQAIEQKVKIKVKLAPRVKSRKSTKKVNFWQKVLSFFKAFLGLGG